MSHYEGIASKVFGVPASEVTRTQRNWVKTRCFGFTYGHRFKGLEELPGPTDDEIVAALKKLWALENPK